MSEALWLAPPTTVAAPWLPAGAGGGTVKARPDDFVVDEIPAYPASGEGDFLYLYVEKVDLSGPALTRVVAERLGIPRAEVGMAGMKDRHARTRQWLSVPAGIDRPPEAIDGPWGGTGEVRLLDARRHSNKLKTGHLRGNAFRIRVRDRDVAGDEAVAAALHAAAERGFPNTFGTQRFSDGRTVERGLGILAGRGGGGSPRIKRLAASAVQSAFFNHWLAVRAADGLLEAAVGGDVLMKRASGGVFICEEPDVDTPRLREELVVSGPMPGSRPSRALGAALERELALHALLGTPPDAFGALGRLGRGARRAALAFPEAVSVARDDEGLVVSFTLPAGSYATVLLALLLGPDHTVGVAEEDTEE
ncbi:MAG: tRNA pseudouridine(13) synthase TruD [Deltaproteobacteria bacterium]|nr:MAG: tRNA pseudouridine(13) synthase TruD [Deltaproteobacteria bacterium]